MTTTSVIKIGTRGSKLALAQAHMVQQALQAQNSGLVCEVVTIKTEGDRLSEVGQAPDLAVKGLFVKQLEEALMENQIDLAVHSTKDVETRLPDGLELVAVLEREVPEDAWITRDGVSFEDLPEGAKVGASSLRRQAQLKRLRRDLEYVDIRGNVDTRLNKLDAGEVDALVLAACGLKRLGLSERITQTLSIETCLPAPAQGAIGIQIRSDREDVRALVMPLNDEATLNAVRAERAFLNALGGNCRVPIGALATTQGDNVAIEGMVAAPDGRKLVRKQIAGPLSQPERIGKELASHLRAIGADRLLYGAWTQ